jgi:hypothetical protein
MCKFDMDSTAIGIVALMGKRYSATQELVTLQFMS